MLKFRLILLIVPPICKTGIAYHIWGSMEREEVQARTLGSGTPVHHVSLCWCHGIQTSEAESQGVTYLTNTSPAACGSMQVGPLLSYCHPPLLYILSKLPLPEVVSAYFASQTRTLLSKGCLWSQEVWTLHLCGRVECFSKSKWKTKPIKPPNNQL